jgi:hypothetical protein
MLGSSVCSWVQQVTRTVCLTWFTSDISETFTNFSLGGKGNIHGDRPIYSRVRYLLHKTHCLIHKPPYYRGYDSFEAETFPPDISQIPHNEMPTVKMLTSSYITVTPHGRFHCWTRVIFLAHSLTSVYSANTTFYFKTPFTITFKIHKISLKLYFLFICCNRFRYQKANTR